MNLTLRMEREPKPGELQPAEPPPEPPQPAESTPETPQPAEPARPPHATPDYSTKAEGPDD
jgi:hypothetical protein